MKARVFQSLHVFHFPIIISPLFPQQLPFACLYFQHVILLSHVTFLVVKFHFTSYTNGYHRVVPENQTWKWNCKWFSSPCRFSFKFHFYFNIFSDLLGACFSQFMIRRASLLTVLWDSGKKNVYWLVIGSAWNIKETAVFSWRIKREKWKDKSNKTFTKHRKTHKECFVRWIKCQNKAQFSWKNTQFLDYFVNTQQ